VFREARAAGLVCSYVSNGNGTPEVLRLHPALGLALQGGPQELPRPPLPRAGGTLERVLWTIRSLARARHLGGDRDAAGAGLQRLGRGADGHRAVPGLRLTRHPVARDRVPQGLQDDGPADTSVRTLLRAAETGAREGLHFVYAGEHPGRGRGVGGHALSVVPRRAHRAPRVPRAREPDPGRRLPCAASSALEPRPRISGGHHARSRAFATP
jgi:hypothetical protein